MHSYDALTYYTRVQATVGVGTVLIWDFGVAYTGGGGGGGGHSFPCAANVAESTVLGGTPHYPLHWITTFSESAFSFFFLRGGHTPLSRATTLSEQQEVLCCSCNFWMEQGAEDQEPTRPGPNRPMAEGGYRRHRCQSQKSRPPDGMGTTAQGNGSTCSECRGLPCALGCPGSTMAAYSCSIDGTRSPASNEFFPRRPYLIPFSFPLCTGTEFKPRKTTGQPIHGGGGAGGPPPPTPTPSEAMVGGR